MKNNQYNRASILDILCFCVLVPSSAVYEVWINMTWIKQHVVKFQLGKNNS